MRAVFRWWLSALEEKRDNGLRRLSATRVSVAVFTLAYTARLFVYPGPLGWPEAFLGFCVLFALPLSKALDRATPDAVIGMLGGMFGKGKPAEAPKYERPKDLVLDSDPDFDESDEPA